MNRKGWLSAVLLAALGAGHQVSPGAASGKQALQPSSAVLAVQPDAIDRCNALRAYFGLPPQEKEADPCLPSSREILFVIATAPNPANSQLALSFDRTIDAIQRAAGDRGFLFDRFVFPWDAQPHRQTEPDKRRAEEKIRRDSEAKPGMLLFRGNFKDGDPMGRFKLLVVLLVPENPSSGVNGDAFRAAADFIRKNQNQPEPIRLLGPSFSSSVHSLHEAIHFTRLRYIIRTGSATVPGAWLELNGECRPLHPFAATVRDDDQAADALEQHLGSTGEWHKAGRIAFLSESGTLYGAAGAARVSESKEKSRRLNQPDRLNLVFPRGISWVRNAYQDLPASAAPTAAIPAPVARLLPFAMSEPSFGDDKPPSLSAGQTPISEEAALLGIANTLRHERVRFVVLTGTDPLDNIFLIRFLRTHCPDLRIITFESDLLYVRAASEFPATGVVLVTTYPLFLHNQVWTAYGSPENRVPFVCMGSEGTYNALRSLLMDAAGGPYEGLDTPLDYLTPFEPGTRTPPIWLMVTTPAGYWPLAVLGDQHAAGDMQLQRSKSSDLLLSWPALRQGYEPDLAERTPALEYVNRLWYSLAFAFVAVGIILLLVLRRQVCCANFPVLCNLVSEDPKDPNDAARTVFRSVVLLSLAMLDILLAWPAIILHRNGPSWLAIVAAAVLVAVAVGLVLSVKFGARLPKATDKHGRHYRYTLFLAVAVIIGWLELWRRTFSGGAHHEGFFAAYRSLDLVNGVAPTVPFALLLLGIVTWACVHLKRLRMLSCAPLPGDDSNAFGGYIGQVYKAIEAPLSMPGLAYPVVISGALTLYLVMAEYTQGLEMHSFDVLYCSAFSLMVLLLVLTCIRLLRIWKRLRRLLMALEMDPVRDALSAIPLRDEWGPILHRTVVPAFLRGRMEPHAASAAAAAGEPAYRMAKEIGGGIPDSAPARTAHWPENKAAFDQPTLDYVLFIQMVCRQMENLLVFLTAGFVLTLISLNSYPFQSGHVLGWFMADLLIAIGLVVTLVLARSERDPILRRLNDTLPGKIGNNFYLNLLSYGALPVLTLFATQFPAIGSFLFSWVQPLLQALRD